MSKLLSAGSCTLEGFQGARQNMSGKKKTKGDGRDVLLFTLIVLVVIVVIFFLVGYALGRSIL